MRISLIAVVLGLLLGCNEVRNANADPEMSLSQARQLIAASEKLDSIPRSVWKQLLSEQQYEVMWEGGTERAGSGKLLYNKAVGTYVSAGCNIPVFRSEQKYESGSGWPSFWEVFDKNNVILKTDYSWGMRRTEVLSKCGEHLGHVFDDGPQPTGLRYCINSAALKFVPDSEADAASAKQDGSAGLSPTE